MVPPGDIGAIPIWVGVYALFLLAAAVGCANCQRVFLLALPGRTEGRGVLSFSCRFDSARRRRPL